MRRRASDWLPVGILALGCGGLLGVRAQLAPQLRAPLDTALPAEITGRPGLDVAVSDAEAAAAAFTDYALRIYQSPQDSMAEGEIPWASAYIGFYDRQTQGHTIHSPKNCLPGGGWQPLSSRDQLLDPGGEGFTVNRYILQNGEERALVLYWYQGRGRVAHNEYLVKWDLLRDAALKRRTDESLVRVVVPVTTDEEASFEVARELAERIKPLLDSVLPL